MFAPILIIATVWLGNAIVIESALSFLGLGTPPPIPTWGGMLSGEGRRNLENAPYLAIFPGLAISIVVLAFNMFGDALRDLLDPRLRTTGDPHSEAPSDDYAKSRGQRYLRGCCFALRAAAGRSRPDLDETPVMADTSGGALAKVGDHSVDVEDPQRLQERARQRFGGREVPRCLSAPRRPRPRYVPHRIAPRTAGSGG